MSEPENTKETALNLDKLDSPDVGRESHWVDDPDRDSTYPMQLIRIGDRLMTPDQAEQLWKDIMREVDDE